MSAVSYKSAHDAVRAARGRAVEHKCRRCPAPAAHWAYDHGDGSAVTDERGRTYSLSIKHYIPLCAACHMRFDQHPSWVRTLAAVVRHPCPLCGAGVGVHCRSTSSGKVYSNPRWQHKVRMRPNARKLLILNGGRRKLTSPVTTHAPGR